MRNICIRIFNHIELLLVILLGLIRGMPYIVRYLRNPNAYISAKVLRFFGARVGVGTGFKGSIYFDNVYEDDESLGDFSNLEIGKNCYIGEGCYFDLVCPIHIEDNVTLSAKVSLITHQDVHPSDFLSRHFRRETGKILLRSGCWLCFNSTVTHGVEVGSNAVLGAHSLLRSNALPKGLYAGVPAKILRELD